MTWIFNLIINNGHNFSVFLPVVTLQFRFFDFFFPGFFILAIYGANRAFYRTIVNWN